jgi:hypothetical protein
MSHPVLDSLQNQAQVILFVELSLGNRTYSLAAVVAGKSLSLVDGRRPETGVTK